jgi:hypothetical protein
MGLIDQVSGESRETTLMYFSALFELHEAPLA